MAKVTDFPQTQELTADDIFGTDDLTIVPIEMPEWTKNGKPGVIHFRVMSADAAIKFQQQMKTEAVRRSVFVRIFAECACDSKGNLLFTERDVEKLRAKSIAVFARLQKILLQLNGMAQPDKSWETLLSILTEAGVDANVIALVKMKWDESDEKTLKNG